MRGTSLSFLLVAGLAATGLPRPVPAQDAPPAGGASCPVADAPEPEPFVRLAEEETGVVRLELATRTFASTVEGRPTITLVSAVHLADAAFYAAAQERLDAHELVLYEGVKPAGAGRLPDGATEEERVEVTRGRLELLRRAALEHRGAHGAFPSSLASLEESAVPRWKQILPGLLVDGWGRRIRYLYRVHAPAEPGGASPGRAVFTSDGADGVPDADAASPGDDLRVEAAAGDAPEDDADWDLYTRFAGALSLTYQSDAIDTGGAHWRCSDMSLDELQREVAAVGGDLDLLLGFLRGTSASGKMMRMVLANVARNPKMGAMMKFVMVESLAATVGSGPEGMAGGMAASGMNPLGENAGEVMRVILEHRNAVVAGDLRALLEEEAPPATVAVFYGAAHMPDLERRLAGLGYAPTTTTWDAAIRADPGEAGFTPEQAKRMRKMFRAMMGTGEEKR